MMLPGLITGVRRTQHITATICESLHWPPVPQRVLFKIAMMAFDCVGAQGSEYFNDVLVPVHIVTVRTRL